MIDVIEILTHWYAGRSQNELATSLGVDRKTLRKYTAPAVAAGMVPGGPPMAEADWRRLAAQWFPQLIDYRLRRHPRRYPVAIRLEAQGRDAAAGLGRAGCRGAGRESLMVGPPIGGVLPFRGGDPRVHRSGPVNDALGLM